MAVYRTFIAAQVSSNLISWIQETQSNLQTISKANFVRLTPVEQIHLTLQFIGDTETRKIFDLKQAMNSCDITLPFPIVLDRLSCFSKNGLVSVIWAGLINNEELNRYHYELSNKINQVIPVKLDMFKPHLTLARTKSGMVPEISQGIEKIIQRMQPDPPVHGWIQEIVLFRSELTRFGPVYTRIYTI